MSEVPQIFDRALARLRLRRAAVIGMEDFLLTRAVDDLADRLAPIKRDFADILDFGTPGPQAHALLSSRPTTQRLERISEGADSLGGSAEHLVDLEKPALPAQAFDLIVSLLALQCVNDLPGVLAQVRRALRPDGLMIGAIMGGDTLRELRVALMEAEVELTGGAAPRIAPFADVRSLGQLLQRAGFALPVVDAEVLTVRYRSALHLMRDLRAMGATNVLTDRSRRPLRRGVLLRAAEIYAERFSDSDGKVRATFEMIWFSGWAPHESQQKPLRPGSARMRLADALTSPAYAAPGKDDSKP